MQLGKLTFKPLADVPQLTAAPIQARLAQGEYTTEVFAAAIDPNLADTAMFCETYGISLSQSTNCIVVEAKRADKTWHAACLIMATDMIDVNNKVRRFLDARKISFAPKDTALTLTGMEYGGITPLGLPKDWPILVDQHILSQDYVVIGGGIRASKIVVSTATLANLDNATVMDITK
jgi:prolyl-tRNA editing enzyme YbaK/EbsC (Cys-tRNA(Pro) deacylase)